MKPLAALILFLLSTSLKAQEQLAYSGKQFFALSVPNTDSTSKWYEDVFAMKLLKEIKAPADKVHVRIIGNEFIIVEIIQSPDSKTLTDCGLKQSEIFKMRGLFKTGFYVTNLAEAEKYFRRKNVIIKHGPFTDQEMKTKSIIIEDLNGSMMQVLEEVK